ncbi:uncharacterized protein E0L32_000248 [Thyridium curvatum]|uniref:Heterokaryon incompatibility domain-containing protein n=1 Tax=Thyridium curvatum TaxID=1093900 RepID=A0A507BBA8_9PEZI|nr:uncharacterized protein E0L32_000248 [Thyridium curvatum]TPX15914.1 hypothetical protein E0L32_000248 [Thyridium curvatum]
MFVYEPLNEPTAIRVVVIEPGNWSDPMRCQLRHRISRAPFAYKALSYVWGARSVTRRISVNDQRFDVTINLAWALQNLREEEEECINQHDHRERGHQVSMMRDIYAGAEEVVLFLGDGTAHRIERSLFDRPPQRKIQFGSTEESNSAIFSEFAQSFEILPRRAESKSFCAIMFIYLLAQSLESEKASGIFSKLRDAGDTCCCSYFEILRQLLMSPWWYRIWVVQEAAVAVRIRVLYGNVSATWDVFERAMLSWRSSSTVTQLLGSEWEGLKLLLVEKVEGVQMSRAPLTRRSRPTLLSLLHRFSSRKASDERDKIYALLGLAGDKEIIDADYTRDTLTTYRALFFSVVDKYGSLTPWVGDMMRKNSGNIPSWIPDWSSEFGFEAADLRRFPLQDVYKACGQWKLKVVESEKEFWYFVDDQLSELIESLWESEAGSNPYRLSRQSLADLFQLKMFASRCAPEPFCQRILTKSGIIGQATSGEEAVTVGSIVLPNVACRTSVIIRDARSRTSQLLNSFLSGNGYVLKRPAGDGAEREQRNMIAESQQLATVSWCGQRLTTWSDTESAFGTLRDWVSHINDDSLGVLIGGLWPKDSDTYERITPAQYGKALHWYTYSLLPKVNGDTVPPAANDTDEKTQWSLHKVMRLVTEGRKLFRTGSGGLGLGPGSMQVGDEVHVLPGGNVHYLLRRRTNESPSCPIYGLVGDCYWNQNHQPVHTEPTTMAERRRIRGGIPRVLLDAIDRRYGRNPRPRYASETAEDPEPLEDQRSTIMIR